MSVLTRNASSMIRLKKTLYFALTNFNFRSGFEIEVAFIAWMDDFCGQLDKDISSFLILLDFWLLLILGNIASWIMLFYYLGWKIGKGSQAEHSDGFILFCPVGHRDPDR